MRGRESVVDMYRILTLDTKTKYNEENQIIGDFMENQKSLVILQCKYVKEILFMKEITFVERLFKLLLCTSEFINLSLYIRSAFKDEQVRKNIIDLYVVLFNIILPIIIIYKEWEIPPCILVYFIVTTVLYLLSIVFLKDIYRQSYSNNRSVLFLIFNYIGITLYFAILYKAFDAIRGSCYRAVTYLDAVYFSFVTSTTLGFGDYKPVNNIGQRLVIIQVCIFLLFIVVFFNHFMSLKKNE